MQRLNDRLFIPEEDSIRGSGSVSSDGLGVNHSGGVLAGLQNFFSRFKASTTSFNPGPGRHTVNGIGGMGPWNNAFLAQFRSYSTFMSPAEFPVQQKYSILVDGFAVFPGIVPSSLLDAAEAVIIQQTELEHGLGSAETPLVNQNRNDHALLALYYCSPVFNLVELLLHDRALDPRSAAPPGAARIRHAQVAYHTVRWGPHRR